MEANNKQVGGNHYRKLGEYQPWEVLRHWLTPEEYRGWLKGDAIVYLARERAKNGLQDIEKAGHMLEKLVEVEKEAQDGPTLSSVHQRWVQLNLQLEPMEHECE